MARLGNQHCANCIGTLSFPVAWGEKNPNPNLILTPTLSITVDPKPNPNRN